MSKIKKLKQSARMQLIFRSLFSVFLLVHAAQSFAKEPFDINDWFSSSYQTAVDLSDDASQVVWVNNLDGIQLLVQSLSDNQHFQVNLSADQQLLDVALFESQNLVYMVQEGQQIKLIRYDLKKQKQQLLYTGQGSGRLAENPSGNFPVWFLHNQALLSFNPFKGMVEQKVIVPEETKSVINSAFSGPCVAVTKMGNVYVRKNDKWNPVTQPSPIRKILPDSHCEKLWTLSEFNQNTVSIYLLAYDEKTNSWESKLVEQENGFDIEDFVLNFQQTQLAAYFYDDVYPKMKNQIRQYASLSSIIRTLQPHPYWRVIDGSTGDGRFLVEVQSPTLSPTTYLADLTKRKLVKLDSRLKQASDTWVTTSALKVKSSHSSELVVYLTSSREKEDKQKIKPLIVKLHGGPFEIRDRWRFDPEAQWLAKKGFDVVAINYQGSGGFGKKFQSAAYGKLRDTLEDDIDNVLDYLEASLGYQRESACLMGSSFGGFAALSELIENNENYKCGILISSVTDLNGIYQSLDNPEEKAQFEERFGDITSHSWQNENNLVSQIGELKRPLLVIYSDADPLVPSEQSKKLLKQLEVLNKTHQSLVLNINSHNLIDADSRTAIYEKINEFLLSVNLVN
ncbi:MAG: S9 family peptidase [Gammaproteobacteria bacterium]|nr:S9 family peptidase [Gammaproteobacteria bacterium]